MRSDTNSSSSGGEVKSMLYTKKMQELDLAIAQQVYIEQSIRSGGHMQNLSHIKMFRESEDSVTQFNFLNQT